MTTQLDTVMATKRSFLYSTMVVIQLSLKHDTLDLQLTSDAIAFDFARVTDIANLKNVACFAS